MICLGNGQILGPTVFTLFILVICFQHFKRFFVICFYFYCFIINNVGTNVARNSFEQYLASLATLHKVDGQ